MRTNTNNAAVNALIFNNTTFANIGDATGLVGSGTAGSLYVSLHTAEPGETGNQGTSEVSYTSYARAPVARSAGGFTVAADVVQNAAEIQFPTATGGTATATHWGLGTASSGSGILMNRGPLIASGASFLPGFATASSNIVTIPGHSLSVGQTVAFYPMVNFTAPAGITAGTHYFVKTVSGNDITLSTTNGGSELDITSNGSAYVVQTTSLAISTNIRPTIAAGSLVLRND